MCAIRKPGRIRRQALLMCSGITLVLAAPLSRAQSEPSLIGDCEISSEEISDAYLNVGNVLARIPITGGLFRNQDPHVYRVPADSPSNSFFEAGLTVVGRIGGEIRAAGHKHFGPQDFFPGPLDDDGRPPVDCSLYNRLSNVYRSDLQALSETGMQTGDITDWPWELGAPVVDGDGIQNNYDPVGGDRPEILGHQMIWWIMNDRGNVHSRFRTEPIGLEVRAAAFAFSGPEWGFVQNATFYRFRLRNRNTQPLRSAYVGWYVDVNLGYAGDDLAGSDTTLGLAYYYNASNFDDGPEGYGEAPPAIGIVLLRGPQRYLGGEGNCLERSGEELRLTGHITGKPGAEPSSGANLYDTMRGRWYRTGDHMVYGDNRYDARVEGDTTDWIFPGDPVSGTYWSARNVDGFGATLSPMDERGYISSGPFCLDSGEETDVVFAVIWSRGSDHLDSITRLRHEARIIREIREDILTPTAIPAAEPEPVPDYPLAVYRNFPEPFSEATTFSYNVLEAARVRITIHDVLGRKLSTVVDRFDQTGQYMVTLNASGLSTGLYLARIQIGRYSRTLTLVHVD